MISEEEFEESWAKAIAREEEFKAWEALPEDEKKRLHDMFDDGFRERMTEYPL